MLILFMILLRVRDFFSIWICRFKFFTLVYSRLKYSQMHNLIFIENRNCISLTFRTTTCWSTHVSRNCKRIVSTSIMKFNCFACNLWNIENKISTFNFVFLFDYLITSEKRYLNVFLFLSKNKLRINDCL